MQRSLLPVLLHRVLTRSVLVLAMLSASPVFAMPPQSNLPRITLASVGRLEFRDSGATVDVTLDVKNPTGVDLLLNALTFQCVFNKMARADGKSTAPVTIPANHHALIPVRLSVSQNDLVNVINLVASGAQSVDYQLDGTAQLGPMMLDVPFSQTGNIPFHRKGG